MSNEDGWTVVKRKARKSSKCEIVFPRAPSGSLFKEKFLMNPQSKVDLGPDTKSVARDLRGSNFVSGAVSSTKYRPILLVLSFRTLLQRGKVFCRGDDLGRVGSPLPDRVQQLLLSRSFTFLVEVFKVYALDRVQRRLRLFTLQLVRRMTRMSLVKGFFRTFPKNKKKSRVRYTMSAP